MSRKQKSLHVADPVEVGLRVRAARIQAGLSQAALAGDDCSSAYISRVELGDRTPSLQLLRELARRLDVSAEFLASGSVAEGGSRPRLLEAELALRLENLSEARRLYEDVLEHSTGRDRIEAMTGLGQLAHREGRHREAIQQIEEAVEEGGLDPVDHPAIAETLARAYAEIGESAQAVALLVRCVERFSSGDDTLLYIRFASMLGYALTDSGDIGGAERVVAKALVAGRNVADPYARARLYWSQSRLLAEQGNPAAAERYARKTLETLRVTEDTYAIAHALETLAHIYLDLGRPTDALELLEEGEPLIELSGTAPEIGRFRIERARALAMIGETEAAASLAMSVAGQLAEVQPVSRGRAYALIAGLYRDLGDLERAKELYELALECAEGQAPSKHLSTTYRALADVLKDLGRREEAFELLERALEIKDRVGVG